MRFAKLGFKIYAAFIGGPYYTGVLIGKAIFERHYRKTSQKIHGV